MNISPEVLTVLRNSTVTGYTLALPNYLGRELYVKVNDVLVAAGGMWKRKEKVHVFGAPAMPIIQAIVDTGSVIVPQDFGYYPSPPAVVARLIELAELHKRHRVLEPSAGQGAIAYAVAKLGATVDCCELLERNADALRRLKLDGNLSDGFIMQGDFLNDAIQPKYKYDRIIMNPPFEKQADIDHVTHALKFLKPTGLLVSVMSAGVGFRTNNKTKDFLFMLENRGGTMENLPDGSFKQSGTGVGTVIVTINGSAA